MKKYEAIFILDDQKVEAAGTTFIQNVTQYITEQLGGTVEKTEAMGQRQLANTIRKRHTGIYFDMVFSVDEAKIQVLKDHYHLTEAILRLVVFIFDKPDRVSLKPITEEA